MLDEWEQREEARVSDDATLSETSRMAIIQARRGQGLFRKNVRSIETACRGTRAPRTCGCDRCGSSAPRVEGCARRRQSALSARRLGEPGVLEVRALAYVLWASGASFELILVAGRVVRVSSGFDEQTLLQAISLLGGR